jgi:hypothetical protein
MSIQGAVSELNKEIERLVKIRDLLLAAGPATAVSAVPVVAAKKKRTLSAAARKKISVANKARWAEIKKAKAPARAK